MENPIWTTLCVIALIFLYSFLTNRPVLYRHELKRMIGLFRRHPELDAMSACRQVTHLDIQARKLFQFLDELFVLFDYNSSAFHWDELIEYKSREKFLKDAMAYIKSTKLPPKKSII